MLKAILASGLMAALLGTVVVDDSSPSQRVVIDVVTSIGTGCPAGSMAVSLPPDSDSIALDFSSFVVQIGPGTPRTDGRKSCLVVLLIHPPAGYTFALGGVRHTGSMTLASGATGAIRTISYYTGAGQTTIETHKFAGPSTDELAVEDSTPVVGACGAVRNTNVNTELRLDAGASDPATTTSTMTLRQSLLLPVTLLPCP